MFTECRENHAPSWTRILLNAQKRFPRVQDLQGGFREVLGHVARISRRAARFSSRNRETISRCWKSPTFFGKSPTFFGKSPTFFRKSPTFFRKSPTFFGTGRSFSVWVPHSLCRSNCEQSRQWLISQCPADYFTMSSVFFQRPAAYFFTWSAWCMRSCLVRR